MSVLRGGRLLAECLQHQGITAVFTLCGNHVLPIYEGLHDAGIELVDTRTEAGAVMAADAYARATRRPAVAVVTGGPGHTNALTGLATAHAAGSPVVLLSGQSELRNAGMGAQQELDQVAAAAPLCKWARQVSHVEQISRFTAEAFYWAAHGWPGAVHLSLPVDVLAESAAPGTVSTDLPHEVAPVPAHDSLRTVAKLLAEAERPVVIAGNGAYYAHAEAALGALAYETEIPVFTIDVARGMVSDEAPGVFGYADPSLNARAELIGTADVVLLLGKRLDFRLRFGQPPAIAADAKVIDIRPAGAELDGNRGAELSLACDIAAFIAGLAHEAERLDWTRSRAWAQTVAAIDPFGDIAAITDRSGSSAPFHPLAVATRLEQALPDDASLVLDAGEFVQWCRSALPARGPGRWIRLGPMSTCGAGTPMALGLKRAQPDRPVVLLTGDGSVGYYLAEFEAAVRHRLPFVTIVGNDSAWGLEYNLQQGLYGDSYTLASTLSDVRYDRVVSALGGYGEQVTTLDDLGPALGRALDSGLPACLDVPVLRAPSRLTRAVIARGGEV